MTVVWTEDSGLFFTVSSTTNMTTSASTANGPSSEDPTKTATANAAATGTDGETSTANHNDIHQKVDKPKKPSFLRRLFSRRPKKSKKKLHNSSVEPSSIPEEQQQNVSHEPPVVASHVVHQANGRSIQQQPLPSKAQNAPAPATTATNCDKSPTGATPPAVPNTSSSSLPALSVKFEDDDLAHDEPLAYESSSGGAMVVDSNANMMVNSSQASGPPAPPPKPKLNSTDSSADPGSPPQLTSALKNGSSVMNTSESEPITVQHKMVPVRTPKMFTGRVRELMDWRVATFAQNAHQAAFVAVSPREELTFHSVPGEQDRIDFILLKNTGDRPIIYKIKTTSPEKFRVRPSSGYLAASDRVIVRIFLQAGYQETASKEKFLVAAFQTSMSQEQFAPDKVGEIWKSAQKDQLFEYRLLCRVSDAYNQSPSSPTQNALSSDTPGSSAANNAQLEEFVERIRGENRVLIAVTVTVLALLTLLLLYQRSIYHSLATRIDNLAAAKCS